MGLTMIQFRTEVYHQQFAPLERVRRGVRIAREVLGEASVRVRWEDDLEITEDISKLDDDKRMEFFKNALAKRPERLVGRATDKLAKLFPLRSYKDFSEQNCRNALLGARHVHIDGAGHVFAGTCVGIIIGRLGSSRSESLAEMWRNFDYREHPIVSVLVESGPVGLLKLAIEQGYKVRSGYADKCHLCYDLRRYLARKPVYKESLGPAVCYGSCETAENNVTNLTA